MAIFLRDCFHDQCLLPFPTDNKISSDKQKFNFHNLTLVANDFYLLKTTHINFNEWKSTSSKHLGLNYEKSLVYFELFAIIFRDDECIFKENFSKKNSTKIEGVESNNYIFEPTKIEENCLLPTTQFVLFLFNQLFNEPSSSALSLKHEEERVCKKKYPKELLNGRKNLSNFWKTNADKWLNLIHIINYGKLFNLNNNIDIKFQNLKNSNNLLNTLSSEELELSNNIEDIVISFTTKFTPLSSRCSGNYITGGNSYPIELLDTWINWALCNESLNPHQINFSINGFGLGYKPEENGFFSKDEKQVLISSKRNQTLLIVENEVNNVDLIIYRCHDCIINILGKPRSILVSHSRGSKIFFGVCQTTLNVHHSESLSLTGAATKSLISISKKITLKVLNSSPTLLLNRFKKFEFNFSSINTFSHNSNLKKLNSKDVAPTNAASTSLYEMVNSNTEIVIGPCDSYYDLMQTHLIESGFNLKLNCFNNVIFTWEKTESIEEVEKVYSLLDPKLYHIYEQPYSYKKVKQSIKNFKSCHPPFEIPTVYLHQFNLTNKKHLLIKKVLQDLKIKSNQDKDHSKKVGSFEEELKMLIEAEFQIWLRNSGKIQELTGILNLDKDIKSLSLEA
ncbi:hypothetical protein HK099_006201 [Clydaea vesicula]|uniref:C-CAP/cofactor C-like domain-containing protein n=1 Tax=Clydaea vesicula TaxID=447962 RepID=A0AAD5XY83_9FUNG|nr:hypothetical protein HK099_006201 [Clydaea vesicula]